LILGKYRKQITIPISERWLICRNQDASKKIFVVTGILVFDFELCIGVRFQTNKAATTDSLLGCRFEPR